jgi:RimJ/RimL family protein N-acetyltransferase
VDVTAAVRDLLELGYEFKPGYVDNLLKAEAARQEQARAQKETRREQESYNPDLNDTFFYIAGYTSGGAPYGVTWEDMARSRVSDFREKLPRVPTPFSELDEKDKAEAVKRLEELIDEYLAYAEYLPDDEDRDEILSGLCDDLTDNVNDWPDVPYDPFDREFWGEDYDDFDEDDEAEDDDGGAEADRLETLPIKEITADNALTAEFDRITTLLNDELKEDGIELTTFSDSLLVAETERLIIRRFCEFDLESLWAGIMKKPEVMYAWEAGFNKKETRKWLNHQRARYRDDGYGYFAVTLKRGGKLIGQAGLMKSEIDGEEVTEIGYIFNNTHWGKGYAVEAARACVELAFGELGLDRLYASIRPENAASVRLAEKLGMRKIGEFVKTYKEKEMPHDIYALDNPREEPRR